nr:pyruvate kinase [Mycoplasmopsis bovis]
MRSLIEAGATCIRVNFSHGSHEEHLNKFKIAKKISEDMHLPVSLILDTKGPEIRVGKIKGGAQFIPANSEIKIHTTESKYKELEGDAKELSVSYDMSKDLKDGDFVLFDDGKLSAVVTKVSKGIVFVKTLNSHNLKTNKRINLPGVDFSLPFLSEKDINDVKFGISQGVNYIVLLHSLIQLRMFSDLRKLLHDNNAKHIQIISKIESHLGIDNIDEIIAASDGIMVARGDLGLEIPYYDVPYFEKLMIRKCREAGKPVIIATQMLDSMETNPHPTRAEVTDVYYAIELGSDATMLSGETASGAHPLEAVITMSNINKRAENEFYDNTLLRCAIRRSKKKIELKRKQAF